MPLGARASNLPAALNTEKPEKRGHGVFDASPCLPSSETSVFAKAIPRRAWQKSHAKSATPAKFWSPQRRASSQSETLHKRSQQTDLLTPNGVRETVSRVNGEQIRLSPSCPTACSPSRGRSGWPSWSVPTICPLGFPCPQRYRRARASCHLRSSRVPSR